MLKEALTQTKREDAMHRQRWRLDSRYHKPRKSCVSQELEEAGKVPV